MKKCKHIATLFVITISILVFSSSSCSSDNSSVTTEPVAPVPPTTN